ncbi:MAG TPA: DNA helicase RecQ [Rhizomicrobium sp.]|jgi:ATP-dependent DNA helicase RecQ|nr:DNA helicase RecQ [Rhizomicrobium sp.]
MSLPAPSLPSKLQILRDVFGFAAFRPGQETAIDAVLAGRSVLSVMPTGSGKSLCFQVPALVLGGLTVVVSPLVALMQDQVAALRLAGVAADTINSSRGREDNVAAWRRAAAGETRLLYLSPERLMTASMLAALGRLPLRLIAVDEAHCISQWGPAFRPDYESLARLREEFRGVPIMALTATADESTRADIAARLFGGAVEQVVLGFDRPNIKLTVSAKQGWKEQLLAFVRAHDGQSGIVYCLSRKRTEEAAALLAAAGIKALAYHAGMAKEAREANQNAFMTEPYTVMAATIAFGMGIDKADVRYVFHADLPGSLEAYYQEIGRAGRDGAPAEAHMLFGLGDIRMRRMFIEQEESNEERKRREQLRLAALVSYCEAPSCRRRILLGYFGEHAEPCGNCDACVSPAALLDGTHEARQILDVIQRTGERYGAAHIVDVLRGAETEKIAASGHDRLRIFGCGAARKKEEWRSLIRQLVAGGFVSHDVAGYGGLSLLGSGRALLRGEGAFHYRPDAARGAARKERVVPASGTLTPERSALLAALKKLRLRIAAQRHLPAYLIFSDKTLLEMAASAPRNLHEFAMIGGVGASKLRDFGQLFVDAISAHGDGANGRG